MLFLNEKIKKQIQDLCSDIDFQTDHLLPDSVNFLHTLMFFTWVKDKGQATTPGTLYPTLYKQCVGSLMSQRVEI